MMFSGEAFRVLQISPTDNKKEIKKAYAALVKKYHPEDFPEEWRRIHDAYESAILYTQKRAGTGFVSEESAVENEETGRNILPAETLSGEPSDSREMESMFDNLEELAANQKMQMQRQQDERLRVALWKLDRLSEVKKVKDWEEFFYQQDMEVLSRGEFLYKWGDILSKMKISKQMRDFFSTQIEDIAKYCAQNGIKHTKVGVLSPLDHVRIRVKRQTSTPPRVFNFALMFFILFLIGLLLRERDEGITSSQFQDQLYEEMLKEAQDQTVKEALAKREELLKQKEEVYTTMQEEAIDDADGLQEKLKVLQTNPGAYTYGLTMLRNAALLQDGMCLAIWDTPTRKNDISYNYKVITDTEEIATINGQALTDKEYYAVKIWTTEEAHVAALCFMPEQMGFSEDCKVYYSDEEDYVEVEEWNGETLETGKIYGFRIGDARAFVINVPQGDENNGVKVVFVNE